jgi:hypothetical protein
MYDKAIENYKIAIKIRIKILSEGHPFLLQNYKNLRICYIEKMRSLKILKDISEILENAEKEYREALDHITTKNSKSEMKLYRNMSLLYKFSAELIVENIKNQQNESFKLENALKNYVKANLFIDCAKHNGYKKQKVKINTNIKKEIEEQIKTIKQKFDSEKIADIKKEIEIEFKKRNVEQALSLFPFDVKKIFGQDPIGTIIKQMEIIFKVRDDKELKNYSIANIREIVCVL